MLPGKRTNDGALYVTQGPPPAGTPLVGGIAVSHTGVIYVSQSFNQPFTPADLFKMGEQGAWYDPSDLTTMFQSRLGETPVTADGQTVGLILDKSKGLVLGPELVTNGDFSSGTGWTLTSATINAGALDCSGAAWTNFATRSITAFGASYVEFSFSVSNYVSGSVGVAFSGYIGTANGTYTVRRYNEGYYATANIQAGVGGFVGTVDNVSIKVVSGNHAVAPSDAARPLKASTGIADWTNYDAVDDVLNTTFASSLGSSCTIGRANVGSASTITTAQTIGTGYADSTDNAGLIIVNRALTTQETTDLTAWLTAKGATA